MLAKNKIHHGDSFELIKQVEDNSIDLILTDPPYEISRLDGKHAYGFNKNGLDFGEWDTNFDLEGWLETIVNKPKKDTGQIIIFNSYHSIEPTARYLEKNGYTIQETPPYWLKTNPIPHYPHRLPLSSVEQFVWATRGDNYTFNYDKFLQYQDGRYLASSHEAQKERFHATQKPLGLWIPLIKVHTNKQDIVLDTFGGSGTTAVACERYNRNYIVIEKDDRYYKKSNDRLKREKKKSKPLFK